MTRCYWNILFYWFIRFPWITWFSMEFKVNPNPKPPHLQAPTFVQSPSIKPWMNMASSLQTWCTKNSGQWGLQPGCAVHPRFDAKLKCFSSGAWRGSATEPVSHFRNGSALNLTNNWHTFFLPVLPVLVYHNLIFLSHSPGRKLECRLSRGQTANNNWRIFPTCPFYYCG